ncbi:uncharacterized protein PRCAT00000211001 [Priceomyces carsonii]|uniref:uncharacterized protein n=1 Tax=Priceomyces carsonii TaxID=28549 RepID=UPI002EDB215E|nr:unnamed protein product [Priceomyces carsonii]
MVSLRCFTQAVLAFTVVEGISLVPLLNPYADSIRSLWKGVDSSSHQAQGLLPLVVPGDKPVPGNSPIVQCESDIAQLLDLQSVVILPNPPVRGENLTFIAEGYVSKDIEDGAYVEVDVRYGYIKLIHQTFDLCEEITKVDLSCPINKGNQIIKKEVEIPKEVPSGKYIVNARAYTKDDEFITCLSATVEFPTS